MPFRPALHPFLQRPARRKKQRLRPARHRRRSGRVRRAHRRIQEFIDPEQLVLFFKLPALFYEDTKASIDLFSREVLPGVRRR